MHDGHRDRMKQRYLETGLDGFSDIEILEFFLFYAISRQDTNVLAHRLLRHFGDLATVMEAPVSELCKVEGIGEHSAILLSLIAGMDRRYLIHRVNAGKILTDLNQCGEFLVPYFFGFRDEAVGLLCLDAKAKVLDCRILFHGSVNAVEISIRKIVERIMACNATSVVLAHNHTSGIALPSQEDHATTIKLKTALDALGVQLLDHVVVAGDDFVSMAQSGFFK